MQRTNEKMNDEYMDAWILKAWTAAICGNYLYA